MLTRLTLLIIFQFISLLVIGQTGIITGTIRSSGKPIQFANIGIAQIGIGATADEAGRFELREIAYGTYELQASYVGYETTKKMITIDSEVPQTISFEMRDTSSILGEVVVSGVTKATLIRENPISIISISPKAIERATESNIIDVLTRNAPGLNAVKTGPNISKPFIRGLGYNRVLTLYDGMRQEGQQWGDEHGIEVDAYNIYKAEVIKGPSSLMYGSDAVAGVVSLMPYIPADQDGHIRGSLTAEYQSNNGLIGSGIRIGSSSAHWLWAARGSYRLAKNYTNRIDGPVYNTGFDEKNFSVLGGYTSDKGYSHLNVSYYDNLQGIPDGSRDSLSRRFTRQEYEGADDNVNNRPILTDRQLDAYRLSPLHQHIQHTRVYMNNHYSAGKGDVDFSAGYQQNSRREFTHPTQPRQAGLYVQLNTVNYNFRYNAPKIRNIEISAGINGMYQNNKNKDATDFPIPDYNLIDGGIYAYAKWKYKKWTVSGGVRYDLRYIHNNAFYITTDSVTGFNHQAQVTDAGATSPFPAFAKIYSGISLSLGSTYQITEHISVKANIARGYRAPNITEIMSNGLDPGAHIVYLGNKTFRPEFSLQEDIGITGTFCDVAASVSLFNNNIQNYIYLTQLVDENGDPIIVVQGNRTYQYQQSSAQLYGMEATLDIHPVALRGFIMNNSFSMVYGVNTKKEYRNTGVNGEYLPLIPPIKLLSRASQEIKIKNKVLKAVTVNAELEFCARQNRYLALNNTETATPAYALANAGVSIDVQYSKRSTFQLQFQVTNIFDAAYQSGLSRLKYFEYYTKSPNGRSGMYNMGRNLCAKLVLPF